jgi:DNA-binding FadR family transcriptional regulator
MPKLRKAKNLSLVEDVTRQIEEAILSGEYRPGDKLPSTRQLQEILGASLGTVRESLAILEQKGLLRVRKGAKGGFFIREASTQPMAESLEMLVRHMAISMRELFEFRATIEAGMVGLVCERATEDQVSIFRDYLDRLKACLNRGRKGWLELCETEQELRREFLKVIRNRTYEAVLNPINDNLLEQARHNLDGGDRETQEAYDYWALIIPAIADRDGDRAASLVRDLLYHFMGLVLAHTKESK